MKPYTFFKIGYAVGVPPFEIEHFADDQEAKDYAVKLLTDPYKAVEVWDGSESVRVEREATPQPSLQRLRNSAPHLEA